MRKKFLSFTAIAAMLFLVACSNEEQIPDVNTETVRTLSLTATMPGENKQPIVSATGNDKPTTRVALEQNGKDIVLRWEAGDVIELLFVADTGRAKVNDTLTVENITNDGKKAQFNIPIPEGLEGDFTLYGLYGGRGIDFTSTEDIVAVLPSNPGVISFTEGGQTNVMLYFKTTMQTTDNEVSVSFKHIGSLFNIFINNITPSIDNLFTENPLTEIRLVGLDETNNEWAFNNFQAQYFDLESEVFKNISETSPGNYLSFFSSTPVSEGTVSITGWYPPLSPALWPALQLQLIGENGAIVVTSTNTKQRNTPTEAGMSYYLYASFNESNELSFVAPF